MHIFLTNKNREIYKLKKNVHTDFLICQQIFETIYPLFIANVDDETH